MITFLRASPAATIVRTRNSSGAACKASDGVSTCDAATCYFEPNSYACAIVQPGMATTVIYASGGLCYSDLWGSSHTKSFSNINGTFPLYQTCRAVPAAPATGTTKKLIAARSRPRSRLIVLGLSRCNSL
ncbi:MAG: hypothetical protein ABI591_12905 [Kofleriaceae bacterium]